ncbi:MAG: serine/threonine protein phosphatase [Parashewanella sp.]
MSFEFQGKKYWLKQAEKLHGIMRLLKGDANKAFEREIKVLKRMNSKHAPVPKIICQDADFFVLEDSGKTVKDWVCQPNTSQISLQKIINDSSQALAKLHSMNLTHGRPALRDICWDKGAVIFIDFESKYATKNIEKRQVRDLILFIHSLFRYLGPNTIMIAEAIEHYRNSGGEWVWLQTAKFVHSWQWLYYLTIPFKYNGGKDLTPVFWTLNYFRDNKT